jgi:3'-phosphoadenosine 5'-phosphosulfate sulfotransferase (PAPS reductase)/FAD synthetase
MIVDVQGNLVDDGIGSMLFISGKNKNDEEYSFDLYSYDKYIVYFSGGKDSTACLLRLLQLGVTCDKIELWHHCVDGKEGSTLMDWCITEDYCRKFAAAFNIPIYYSWKEGGFEKEMLRENSQTAPIWSEVPNEDGTVSVRMMTDGHLSNHSTRRKFPQLAATLSERWCSSYLKVDVGATSIRNQERFRGLKVLTISGERGEESAARSKYNEFEIDRADCRLVIDDSIPADKKELGRRQRHPNRHVDRWRPIKNMTSVEIWDLIGLYRIVAHPAYYLGFGRVSCAICIFLSANQAASLQQIMPSRLAKVSNYEDEFGYTIKRKGGNILALAAKGTPYDMDMGLAEMANSEIYTGEIFTERWKVPAGAFAESAGPL